MRAQGAEDGGTSFLNSSVILEAGLTERGGLKMANARLAGRRKETKESSAEQVEQLCVVNCSWIIFQIVLMRPTIRRCRCLPTLLLPQVPKLLQNLSSLLPRFFCLPYTIAIASPVWRTFTSLLFDVFSFLSAVQFRCFEVVHVFNVVNVSCNLIELHLIPKMPGSHNNSAAE